jgi:hypothetical protein
MRARVCFHICLSNRIDACACCWKTLTSACTKPRGTGVLAHTCVGCKAISIEATGSGRRERSSPDTTLHSVGGASPWCCECVFSYRSLRAASKGEDVQSSKRASAMETLPALWKRNCGWAPRCVACGDAHASGSVSCQSRNLNVAAAEGITLPTIVVAVSGKKRRLLLLSCCCNGSVAEMIVPRLPAPESAHLSHLPSRRKWALAGTTLSERPRRQSSGYARLNPHFVRHGKMDWAAGCPSGRPM